MRDDYENKKDELEKKISDKLGVPWKIEINPLAIWPYAKEGSYMRGNPGSCLHDYIDGVPWRLEYLITSAYNESFRDEVNTICYEHTVIMGPDESGKTRYCGCDVVDGKLRILFNPDEMGTNISSALEELPARLDEAPQPAGPDGKVPILGPLARLNISTDYIPKVGNELDKLKKWFSPDFVINPNFEENYTFLKNSTNKDLRDDWAKNIGYLTLSYVEGCTYYLDYKEFKSDDMLQEGFNEAVEKHEIKLRIVDKLQKGSGYNECIIENGVLVIQVSMLIPIRSIH